MKANDVHSSRMNRFIYTKLREKNSHADSRLQFAFVMEFDVLTG
jgi:hypothetical protein